MADLKTIYYEAGENPKPETNPTQLRMYSHNLCPFVERAVLAFAAKAVPYQKCEMQLQNKAQWHLDFNGGFIPVLETPEGHLVKESAVVAQFAVDYAGPNQGLKLWPNEGAVGDVAASLAAAQMRINIQEFESLGVIGLWYNAMINKLADAERNQNIINKLPEIEAWVVKNLNGKDFLGGDQPAWIDIHAFTPSSRIIMWEGSIYDEQYKSFKIEEVAPQWKAWVLRMQAHPVFEKECAQTRYYHKHTVLQHAVQEPGVKYGLSLDYLEREE